VFEATSGNFGLALGLLRSLGLEVVALVSRKLQEGVTDELSKQGVKTVNLDVDICPVPGLQINQDLALAKATASSVREQLISYGLDETVFDRSAREVEQLLERQDVIGLAKLLAKIYQGFCPEQYDNDQNVLSHETVTGPEIDQQLKAIGRSLKDFIVICAFGTGGTSTGLSNYVRKKYGTKNVHVVYPLGNQDVAGIRTKEKSTGLKFYLPDLYGGQHEVDFQAAKPLLRFLAGKGYDIGESSALALYGCLQMLNYGVAQNFTVIIADGSEKYAKVIGSTVQPRYEITLDEVRTSPTEYGTVLWTHTTFTPRSEGVELIASALQVGRENIKVVKARDVQAIVSGQSIPEGVLKLIPEKRKVLLVCMVGATSLRVAELLGERGIEALSVTGGIMNLPEASGKSPPRLIQIAGE
jgi:cysteine synthase